VLAKKGVGHISPVAAYSAQRDAALVLDVAAYTYPYTWIPLPKLWRAMQGVDSDSGKTRG
jgi:glutathione gamma-glutamylcysteinyltransferase